METLNTLRYANRAQNIENVPLMKSDSRENIVLKLKRELRKLKEENYSLKVQLGYINGPKNGGAPVPINVSNSGRLPKINTNRNGSSNSTTSSDSDLYGRLQEYIQENKTLKNENSQLEKFREKIRKEHEILTRENEKLARKLDQLLRTQGGPGGATTVNSTSYMAVDDGGASLGRKVVKTSPAATTVVNNRQVKVARNVPVESTAAAYSSSPVLVRKAAPQQQGQVIYVGSGGSKKTASSQNSAQYMSDQDAPLSASLEYVILYTFLIISIFVSFTIESAF